MYNIVHRKEKISEHILYNIVHRKNKISEHIMYNIVHSKVGDHSRGWPEGSLFDSYYTNV